MIHFFPTFSDDVSKSPLARELAASGVPHRFFPARLVMHYKHRIWLALVGWPRLALLAARAAWRSLRSLPSPDVLVLGSHIEVLVFTLMRLLLRVRRPTIVLLGFIYTARRRAWINALRRLYFRVIFSMVDQVICFSRLEQKRYSDIFRGVRARFVAIPYGLHIEGRRPHGEELAASNYAFSAGRSGRDYPTLMRAIDGLDIDVHIICDSAVAMREPPTDERVVVLRNCYDRCYIDELERARLVVIPLAVGDISAGQMVLLEAMAFGKPVIITRTATVEEYAHHEWDALLVPHGDAPAMRSAIQRLLADHELANNLAKNARITYEAHHSMRAYVRNLIDAIAQGTPGASRNSSSEAPA